MKLHKSYKYLYVFSFIVIFNISSIGCSIINKKLNADNTNTTQSPNSYLPSIMINEQLYFYSGTKIDSENFGNDNYDGTIISIVSLSQRPNNNNEANIDVMDAPYIFYENGIALLWNNEWSYFVSKNDLENE